MPEPTVDFAGLSTSERLELIGQLWDSLSPEAVPVSATQRRELRERVAALDRGEMETIPLEQAITAIRAGRESRRRESQAWP